MKKPLFALLIAGLLSAAAYAGPPPRYFVDESKLPFPAVPGFPTERLWGVLNNAGYRIEVPHNWNGSLVMWAHGYRGDPATNPTALELTVDNHPLREFLIAQGYAWAASSYSRNAYDPAQGAKDTHALTQFFNGRFAKPRRTYITGASMGGHVTGVVAEQWPRSYDGAMPVCGVLGDYELFDFFLDFNVAAQSLSGVGKQFPFGADYLTATVPATKAALGPAFPFALNAQGQALAGLTQMRTGGVRPVFDQGWLFWNGVAGDFLFGLGVGNGTLTRQPGMALQNSDVVYQFDADPVLSPAEQAFNAGVQRLTADRQARRRNGIANVPPTTGNLKIPMLTLHTLGDLFVPFHMEQEYARRVAANGASNLLVQRVTRDFGHCTFTPTELVTTFVDLVKWVDGGLKPAGDNVLDPAVVASPTYGCTYTDKTAPRIWDNPQLAFLKPPACPTP
jgi:pimeloyl-ACP methyl ester carboxylesterase